MKQVKLSIISACYNGEAFIGKHFDNLLEQTFHEYELIIVNDGSSDASNEIIERYKKKFEAVNISVKYINNPLNGGHAKAINDGLKLVEGKYLMWLDIDDFMYSNHLEKRVDFMENNPEYDIALGKVAVRDVRNIDEIIYYAWQYFPDSKKKLVESFILGESRNVGYMSGNFIIKTNLFWKIYKDREIYSNIKIGANIQMVFPMIYFGKTGYIKECTFNYYVHGNNQHITHEKEQYFKIEKIYENVINQINVGDAADKLKRIAANAANRLLLSYSLKHKDKELGMKAWKKLKRNHGIRIKEVLKYILIRVSVLNKLYIKLID